MSTFAASNEEAKSDAAALPPGVVDVAGDLYMKDHKGTLVPIEVVRPQHKLEDQTVRMLFKAAEDLHLAMAAFKEAAFSDIDAFVDQLAAQYDAKAGGDKGNMTLQTYDGLLKVQVQVADRIAFGAELQVAKQLVDECLKEWSVGSKPQLRAMIANAFRVDKEGRISPAALLPLLRLDFTDERWVQAMSAIRDSIRVVGSCRYLRFYRRGKGVDRFEPLSLDMATV